jgi:hypothetical protein
MVLTYATRLGNLIQIICHARAALFYYEHDSLPWMKDLFMEDKWASLCTGKGYASRRLTFSPMKFLFG